MAEDPDAGTLVGYARSIERGGLFELTEFFVLPTHQARGVGRALIERAFPAGRGDVRSIIATTDVRALARYYAAGTVARFPMLTIGGVPGAGEMAGDLTPQRIDLGSEQDLDALRTIERSVLGVRPRRSEVRWLLEDREATSTCGAVTRWASPSGGRAAVVPSPPSIRPTSPTSWCTSRGEPAPSAWNGSTCRCRRPTRSLPPPAEPGFRLDPWVNLLMSDRAFGLFDRFLSFGPPVFL